MLGTYAPNVKHLPAYFSGYREGVPTETFAERFKRLTKPLKDAEVAMTLGLSMAGIRKIREGETQTLKLDAALRLCRRLGISPWELAGEPDPTPPSAVDGAKGASQYRRALGETNLDLAALAAEVRDRLDRVEARLDRVEAKRPAQRRAG